MSHITPLHFTPPLHLHSTSTPLLIPCIFSHSVTQSREANDQTSTNTSVMSGLQTVTVSCHLTQKIHWRIKNGFQLDKLSHCHWTFYQAVLLLSLFPSFLPATITPLEPAQFLKMLDKMTESAEKRNRSQCCRWKPINIEHFSCAVTTAVMGTLATTALPTAAPTTGRSVWRSLRRTVTPDTRQTAGTPLVRGW